MTPVIASEVTNGRYVAWVLASIFLIVAGTMAVTEVDRRLSAWWRDRRARRDPIARDVAAVCRHHRQQRALERACTKREGAA